MPLIEIKLLTTSVSVWIFCFGSFLILCHSIFTLFPTSVIGVLLIYILLYNFRIPLPPTGIIDNIFGSSSSEPSMARVSSFDNDVRIAGVKLNNANDEIPKERLWVIAHRGCGLDAPENSLISFIKCAERGGTCVEFDVIFTKDKVPVIFHDDNLLRLTGIDRELSDLMYSELANVDIATKHPLASKFDRPVRIPTLDEAIETCLEQSLKFIIDIKARDTEIVDVILKAFEKYPRMYQAAILSSFDPKIIYDIRKRDNNIVGCMAWRPGYCRYSGWDCSGQNLVKRNTLFLWDWLAVVVDYMLTWALKNVLWWFIGLSAILIHKDAITKEESYVWKERGLQLFTWSVNTPIEKLYTTHALNIGYLTDTMDGDFSSSGPSSLNASKSPETQLRIASRSSELFATPTSSSSGN